MRCAVGLASVSIGVGVEVEVRLEVAVEVAVREVAAVRLLESDILII